MRSTVSLVLLLAVATIALVNAVSMPVLQAQVLEAASSKDVNTHALDGIHSHFIPLQQQGRTAAEEEEYFDRLEEHHDMLHSGMTMQIEVGESTYQRATADLSVENSEHASNGLSLYKFGKLLGSSL